MATQTILAKHFDTYTTAPDAVANSHHLALSFEDPSTTEELAYVELDSWLWEDATAIECYARWGAASGITSGDVTWGFALAHAVPNTTTTEPWNLTYGTEVTVTDSHLGTTAGREHRTAAASLADPGSMAAGNTIWLRVARRNSSDTLAGAALLYSVDVVGL